MNIKDDDRVSAVALVVESEDGDGAKVAEEEEEPSTLEDGSADGSVDGSGPNGGAG
jgi:hypothetical protein